MSALTDPRVLDRVIDGALTWLARRALAHGRALVALDTNALLRRLGLIERILRRIDRHHPALGGVGELRELVASDPVARQALRKILLGARDTQVISTVRGALRHHVLPRTLLPSDLGLPPRTKPARGLGALRVGLVGASADVDDLEWAYREAGAGHVERCERPTGTAWLRFLERVNAVELGGEQPIPAEAIAACLVRGVAVSLHRGAAPEVAALDELVWAHTAAMARFRVFDPLLFYPPFVALADLVDRNVLGEITTIRLRAIVGGRGAARAAAPVDGERWAVHPAFDRFLALARLGGPLASLTGYAAFDATSATAPGQAVLALAHAYAGRYSHLELVHAPNLAIRSDREPYDLTIEVAGTDGIAWLHRGIAKPTERAPLEVRVGRLHFTVDAAAGLDEDWSTSFRAAASAMARLATGPASPPPLVSRAWLSALRARAAAPLATRLPHVIAI